MAAERKLLRPDVKPVCYNITLEPDFAKQRFVGRVEIECDVALATQALQLHSKDIDIIHAAVSVSAAGTEWNVTDSLKYVPDDDIVEIHIPEQIRAGANLKVVLDYKGKLRGNLEGFYLSKYTADDGTEHEVAVTFLEPTCARLVFPCFDEPHLKAHFIISAVVDPSHLCASNMPIDRTEMLSGSRQLVTFQKSPPMSTYLVGLVAGPLARVQLTKCRIPLSVLCPKGSEDEAYFALELGAKALSFFEDLLDDKFPLPKLDLVAVSDFSSGAMEDWVLIKFRANSLLIDEKNSALDKKQYLTRTLLHEISHSWFGNPVTMKYWDDLWLKEGLATLLVWYAADKLFPDWHVCDAYVADVLQSALDLDALQSSHPIEVFVKDATKAKQMFDDISYKKGCCILSMLLSEIGEKGFFDGLKHYIRIHKFGNATSDDLWDAFQHCSDLGVVEKMRTWTKQPGFPVIRVTELCGEDASTPDEVSGLRLQQRRFVASSTEDSGGESSPWIYPLRISVRSEHGVDMFDMKDQEMVIPAGGKSLLKINADHSGFFRTSYTASHLEKLLQAANQKELSLRDIMGLLADLSALTAAGVNSTSELLDMCLGLRSLAAFPVWKMIDRNLAKVLAVLKFEDSAVTDAIMKVSSDILRLKANELGWTMLETDEDSEKDFKALMFSSAGLAGDPRQVHTPQRILSF